MVQIPEKSYFKIGEVSKIVGVEPYNIRYWESQFRTIRPSKTKSNQRLYRRRDIETLLQIKKLLYEEGFTIAGAKRRIKQLANGDGQVADAGVPPDAGGMALQERQAYAEQLATAQGELDELRARVETLTSEIERTRSDYTEKLRTCEHERQELVALVRQAEAQGSEQSGAMEQRLQHLSEKLTDAEIERTNLAEQLSAARAEQERLGSELQEAQASAGAAGDLREVLAARGELTREILGLLKPLTE